MCSNYSTGVIEDSDAVQDVTALSPVPIFVGGYDKLCGSLGWVSE